FPLSGLAGDLLRIKMAAEGIEDHSVRHSIKRVALLHQRIDDQLAVRVRKKLFDFRLARGVLRGRLVPGHGNPLANSEIRKAGAHCRVTDDNAVKDRWEPLREDHPLASAGRAPHEIRVSSRPAVVARDDVFGYAR